MNLKARTYYIGMLLKKLMVYGFIIQTNARKLQIFLTGYFSGFFFSLVIYSYNLQGANFNQFGINC